MKNIYFFYLDYFATGEGRHYAIGIERCDENDLGPAIDKFLDKTILFKCLGGSRDDSVIYFRKGVETINLEDNPKDALKILNEFYSKEISRTIINDALTAPGFCFWSYWYRNFD